MDIELLKKYMKIDSSDLDDVIAGYQSAAEVYIKNAGCVVDYDNKLCEVIIVILVTKFAENPDLLTNLNESTGITLAGMISQLRMSQAASSTS
jgi:hypothetical protein